MSITDITTSSFKLDDELVDLTDLYTRSQLNGDGKTIHDRCMCVSILMNIRVLASKESWDASSERDQKMTNIARKYLARLKSLL